MSNKNQYEIKSDTEIIIQIVYIFKYLFSQRDYFLQYIFKCAIIMHVMIINIPMYCLVKLEMKFLMLCQICMGQNVRYPEWTNTICKQNFSLRKACNGLMVIISDETSPPAVTNLCVKVCILIVSL